MNDLLRALLCAEAAALALLIIDLRNVAVHMNCIEVALFGTKRAADTSGLADIHDCLALVFVDAVYSVLSLSRNKLDQLARADLDTCLASGTLGLVDLRNTVYNVHCIELAGLYAGAMSKTSEVAGLVA